MSQSECEICGELENCNSLVHENEILKEQIASLRSDLDGTIKEIWSLRKMVWRGRDLAKDVLDGDYVSAGAISQEILEKHTTEKDNG